jgi:hypothetical protein
MKVIISYVFRSPARRFVLLVSMPLGRFSTSEHFNGKYSLRQAIERSPLFASRHLPTLTYSPVRWRARKACPPNVPRHLSWTRSDRSSNDHNAMPIYSIGIAVTGVEHSNSAWNTQFKWCMRLDIDEGWDSDATHFHIGNWPNKVTLFFISASFVSMTMN